MCGSRPEPDDVTASTGTCASAASPFTLAVGGDAARSTASRSSGFVGPRFEAELAMRVVAVAGGRRPRLEVARRRERLTDQPRADDPAVALDERAVRALRERDLGDARHGERIDDAGEHGEDARNATSAGRSWRRISTIPEPADDDVDELDPDERQRRCRRAP